MSDHRLGLVESFARLEVMRLKKARRGRDKRQWSDDPGLYRLHMASISEGEALEAAHSLRTLLRIRRAFKQSPKFLEVPHDS